MADRPPADPSDLPVPSTPPDAPAGPGVPDAGAAGSATYRDRWSDGATTVRRTAVPSLLQVLDGDHLDPGYAQAARRRGGTAPTGVGRTRVRVVAVVGLLVAGLLFGIAASTTDANESRTSSTRTALLDDIDRAQVRQTELGAAATSLADEIRAAQSALGVAGPLVTVSELEFAGGGTAVHGPGVRVILDQAPGAATGSGGGGILDRDIQLLVNDLWAAGAEAVSVGGIRLRPTSAIRQAGQSILVDNRPTFWPLEIDAVGDAAAMQVDLVSSTAVGRFTSFSQLYGIRFELTTQPDLTIPAGGGPDPRYASAPSSPTTAPSSTSPTPTAPSATAPATPTS
ncbi:DUF881 domain-containing protein [Nakamurella flava]|uniref:DUF881 domain-containing protein n=1 Tax=Nakamurella flava TaxID=2576308 RepID=A0A4U6Q6X7_9ACTN|nr:DUF881 domain-containing protein [Nakamurella flava]TKV56149.1 DUF881 domain-containing protein [Nakamurella flava]